MQLSGSPTPVSLKGKENSALRTTSFLVSNSLLQNIIWSQNKANLSSVLKLVLTFSQGVYTTRVQTLHHNLNATQNKLFYQCHFFSFYLFIAELRVYRDGHSTYFIYLFH